MVRNTPTPDEKHVTLLEERDDLTVKLSLAEDSDSPDLNQIEALRKALLNIERAIKGRPPGA